VDSKATAELVTRIFRQRAHGGQAAEVFRQALAAHVHDEEDVRNAHPSYWAPFSLIGDAVIADAS
jgi:CHAT domain-containing protein